MKKIFLPIILSLCLVGCGNKNVENETNESQTETSVVIVSEQEIAEENTTDVVKEMERVIRINGVNYFETNRIVKTIEEPVEDTISGEITSFVSNELPTEDNQSNFGVGYQYQVKDDYFVYLKINDEWHLFCNNEDGENVISFNDKTFLKTELSSTTLEWLEKYNELSEEEKLATNSIPAELIDDVGVDYDLINVESEVEDITNTETSESENNLETETSTENNTEVESDTSEVETISENNTENN